MKTWLINYFSFSKREYSGLLTLLVGLFIVSIIPYTYEHFLPAKVAISKGERLALNKLMLVNLEQRDNYVRVRNEVEDADVEAVSTYFKFDPNKINVDVWKKLGLSAKQAQAIINYRNKGGKFYKPADLQKMYTISPAKFQSLLPYIAIESTSFENKFERKAYPERAPYQKKELGIIDINNADTLQLDEIRGVGAAFARRIVNYRNRLGGFYKKEQLLEVYGLDSAKFEEIKAQVKIEATHISKININTAEFDNLKNHPYLKYKQINAIIQYRRQHGKFNNLDDLKKVAILTPQNIQNLAPYLTF